MSSSNSTGGVMEGGRSSEYEEKPNRAKIEPKWAKIEPKRAKLMRKLKKTKIGPKRAQIRFCNIEATRVMVEPTLVNARGSARTRS